MMTQGKKWLSYVLAAVVILIWGVVIYRAVTGFFAEEEEHRDASPPPIASSPVESGPDSFSLKLDYPDPFLKNVPMRRRRVRRETARRKEREDHGNKRKEKKEKKEEEEATPWPEIEFGGIVRNRSSERVVALMSIDGKEKLMKEGQENGSLSLERVWSDSVRVAFNGEERVIIK